MNRDNEAGTGRGVGLTNIRSRLEQLYDGEHRFELANHPAGGAVVKIALPLRRAAEGAGTEESSAAQ